MGWRTHPLEDDPRRRGVRDEMEHYLEERAREFEEGGMAPDEARRAAEAVFGDPDEIARRIEREHAADRRPQGRRWTVDGIWKDLRFALRGALRRPGLTLVLVLTLGLGIGATTAIFTVVNASILRALPFADADRIVFLQGAHDAPDGPQVRGASYEEAQDWARAARSFEALVPFTGRAGTLTGLDRAERVPMEVVGQDFFDLFRVTPLMGRTFAPAEHALDGSGSVAVLGETLWERAFGRDPAILGHTVTIDLQAFTVVGVVPASFPGATLGSELWIPIEASGAPLSRNTRYLGVAARLLPGVTREEARAEMDAVTARLEAEYPSINEDRIALVTPAREVYLGQTRTLIWVVLGATGLLLLIAAANVTNLLLVRASGRASEMLVRTALGAERARLARLLVAESLTLAAAGTLIAIAFGVWGSRALAVAMPATLLPAYVKLTLDGRVLLFAAVLMTVVGLIGGLAPALQAIRTDVAAGLRPGGGVRRRRGRWSMQQFLVVGEVALAFLLLVGAGLMTRSLVAQLDVAPGYDAERLFSFAVDFPAERYDGATREAAARELLRLLDERPEIASASFANDAPLVSGTSAAFLWLEDAPAEERIRFYRHHVMPGYFETLGIPILRGRPLLESDETPVTVISRAMASRLYGESDPIGRTITVGAPDGPTLEIVGVAGDVRYRDLTTDLVSGPTDPDVYMPWPRLATSGIVVVARATGDPAGLEAVARDAVAAVDPDLAVANAGPMARGIEQATAQGRFGSLLLGVFSALALLLSALGLYGVLAFTVQRRTRELAVRIAVGAPVQRLRWLVVRQGMVLVGTGLLIGLAATLVATRALETFLFEVAATDALTYVVVASTLVLVALIATYLPAVRATRVDPHEALSAE